jgi:iron complex transport system permease protein
VSAHRTTPRASTRTHRGTTLVAASAAVVLLAAVVLSLTIGARDIALADVWRALIAPDAANPDHVVVHPARSAHRDRPLRGAALALAGTVMQGLTRNPFADPGLLGVNAGASVAVLVAITLFGLVTPTGFIWFAFVGAAAAAVLVASSAAAGRTARIPQNSRSRVPR